MITYKGYIGAVSTLDPEILLRFQSVLYFLPTTFITITQRVIRKINYSEDMQNVSPSGAVCLNFARNTGKHHIYSPSGSKCVFLKIVQRFQ